MFNAVRLRSVRMLARPLNSGILLAKLDRVAPEIKKDPRYHAYSAPVPASHFTLSNLLNQRCDTKIFWIQSVLGGMVGRISVKISRFNLSKFRCNVSKILEAIMNQG